MSDATIPDDQIPLATAVPRSHVPDLALHRVFFWMSFVVVFLAVVLTVRGEEEVVVPLLDWPLPGTCTYKTALGIDCPGCGLTRCFISMAHGDLGRAWHFNPAGIFFFLLVASQIPFRGTQLWRLRRGRPEINLGYFRYALLVLALVGLLVQWAVRMLALLSL